MSRRQTGPASASNRQLSPAPALAAVTSIRSAGARGDDGYCGLPAQPTVLIGRQRELAAARQCLRRDGLRLLTLTGAPGVGKTRLALAIAARLVGEYADGVCFVDLAPTRDPAALADAVAEPLGIGQVGAGVRLESLKQGLRRKRLLLVLDNFDQLVSAAPLVADLLATCPEVTILVTSREALQLRWEQVLPVLPLATPDPTRVATPKEMLNYPAVSLFVERARAASPTFAFGRHNAVTVAEICTRLDGLPLAIELAASRVATLTPQAMLARMASRLDLLRNGARDAPARHQTLRVAIRWSYDLLTGAEQAVFRRLGVFVGGCTLEAVEAVCCSGEDTPPVLEIVASLVGKSLLRQEEQADGQPRFRMLETIREYCLELLDGLAADEGEAVRSRQAAHCLALAQAAEPELSGREQLLWLQRLDGDHENLRAALRWLQDRGKAEDFLRLVGALWLFWDIRGHLQEGRGWLHAALALGEGASARLRAPALYGAGILACRQGDYPAADRLLAASLDLWRELQDRVGVMWSLDGLGLVAEEQGDDARGSLLFAESLTLARELGHVSGAWAALNNLGNAAADRGSFTEAKAFYEESLALGRAARDGRVVGFTLANLAGVARFLGDWHEAAAYGQEALRLLYELADVRAIPVVLSILAMVASAEKEWRRAVRLFGAAESLSEAAGAPQSPANRSHFAQDLATARSRLGEAQFAAAWAWGRALRAGEAVAYVLAAPRTATADPRARPPVSGSTATLTSREREVAALIALGQKDHEIATALVISRRTAESHTASIIRKLGFASRAEIAGWVVANGLAGPAAPSE